LTDAIRVGENESVGWKEHAMGGVSAKDVDGHLASIPEDARAALEMRGAIRHERRRRQTSGGIDP
jgi:hypothetical protein